MVTYDFTRTQLFNAACGVVCVRMVNRLSKPRLV
jgi:hypothetical protein